MTVQMYFLRPKASAPPDANEQIAGYVVQRRGFILMATGSGALLVALDDSFFEALKAHPMVEFAGPISFNPHNEAGMRLQQLFATNVARQIVSRQSEPNNQPGRRSNFPGQKLNERR